MSARVVAVNALDEVDTKDAYAQVALERQLSLAQLDKRDRALATELVYGTLRHRGYIDFVIESVSGRKMGAIDRRLWNILRIAVYQIIYLDRIPHSAVVNEAVEMTKARVGRGAHGFANGVLRGYLRRRTELVAPDIAVDPVAGIAVRHSFPEWLVKRWIGDYGIPSTIELCRYFNATPPLVVRVNSLRTQRDELMARWSSAGIVCEAAPYVPEGIIVRELRSVPELPGFDQGLFSVQDVSSMLVGPVVNPARGSVVIDACSAPGGKATHLAELMGGEGKLLALDIHRHKLELVERSARRLGVPMIEVLEWDATVPLEEYRRSADAVLVDAPCSGLGVLNRRPDSRWRKRPDDIRSLTSLQVSILENMAECVRPGGVLVYSTCTLPFEENIGVVSGFLSRHDDFAASSLAGLIPESLRSLQSGSGSAAPIPPDSTRVASAQAPATAPTTGSPAAIADDAALSSPPTRASESLACGSGAHMIQILPFIHHIDGFFIARMVRTR